MEALRYIYVVRRNDGGYPGPYKIGITKHLDKRRCQIEREIGFSLEIIRAEQVVDAASSEDTLHNRFRNCRVAGEWFDLQNSDLAIIDEYLLRFRKLTAIVRDFYKGEEGS